VYRYFKDAAETAERKAAVAGELDARNPDNYRYTTEDIAMLLAKGGGARWHEEQAARLRSRNP
jgi:hypothetical protein